jgi:hypothetical protein
MAWIDCRDNPFRGDVYVALGTMSAIAEPPSRIEPRQTLQVSPNPAFGWVRVSYALGVASRVRIDVYDCSGRDVQTLLDADEPAGDNALYWDPRRLPNGSPLSGIYFITLTTPQAETSTKLAIVGE